MKKIGNILLAVLMMAGTFSLTACSEPDDAMDTLLLERVLSPLDFQLSMEANVNATFTWKAMNASKEYLIELLREDGTQYEARTLTYDASAESLTMSTEFPELPASSKFTARLSALSADDRVADSKPVEIAFETGIENLFLGEGLVADEDVTATSAVMRWKAGSAVTHLDVDNGVGKVQLDEAAIAEGVYTLTGLTTGKTYVVRLYNEVKDAYRGTCTFVASDKIDVTIDDKTSSSISVAWGADVTLTAVGILDAGEEDAEPTLTTLSAEQIAARRFTFEGLKALSEYRISAYNDGVECAALYVTTLGEATAWDFTTWQTATYAEETTVEGLGILAASGKEVYISEDADYGYNFLDLKGKSTIASGYTSAPTQRAVKFSVKGQGVVVIDGYANGAGRNFYAFVDVLGKSYGPVEMPVKADRGKIYIPCPEIPGAAVVYLFTDATINHVYGIEWYAGSEAPGQHAEKLPAPVVTSRPSEITKGDATAVEFSWDAVANAATYDYKIAVTKLAGGEEVVETFSGNTSATGYTLAAEVAAQLKPGTYTFTVNARPASEFKYAPSSAGSATLTVNDTKLTAPEVKFDPAKVTVGDATEVVASWPAVEGAASYEVTFNGGAAETITTTSYTVSAAAVAALAVGEYTISVVARPAEASAQASDAGTAKLTVAEATTGGEQTFKWDFTDSGFDSYYAAIGESNNSTYSDSWNGLTIETGGGSLKAGTNTTLGMRYIQMGGAGSTTKRYLKFSAPASGTLTVVASNTGSSEDLTRMVSVAAGTWTESKAGGYSSNTPQAVTFEVTLSAQTDVVIYPTGNGLRFYSVEFTTEGGSTGPGGSTGEPQTLLLTKDGLTDAGLAASLPKDKATMQALSAASEWTYDGIDFRSVMALSNASASDGSKLPVLYLYKAGTHASLNNFIANTTSLGTIRKIVIKLMDGAAQKGEKFTMTQYSAGVSQTVLSSNDAVSSTEHVYTFDEGNDGKFDFTNGGGSDCKISSIEIEYVK